jgi:hypothetical protein
LSISLLKQQCLQMDVVDVEDDTSPAEAVPFQDRVLPQTLSLCDLITQGLKEGERTGGICGCWGTGQPFFS